MERRVCVLVLIALGVLLLGAGEPPWRARRRPLPPINHMAQGRVYTAEWPSEPASPRSIDPARFTRAVNMLCGWIPPDRATRYATHVLTHSAAFDVDPFLLGALIYSEGRCRSDTENGERTSGLGLTLIHRDMYLENVRGGVLRYRVRIGDRWEERTRNVDRFPFAGPRLLMAEPNVYFAAALLRMWSDQHASIDAAFDQAPHRHFVSHFVWGDRVRSDREEYRILTDRRRLLEYYGAHRGASAIVWGDLTLGCPLDGCPRVITSWIGSRRDGGAREQLCVDVDSRPGERVRAIADGEVVFAGVDLPGGLNHAQLRTQAEYEAIDRDRLGAGGRYVCVRHVRQSSAVRSCYMHLEEVHVQYGQRVSRGDAIGTVGRTGMRDSAAHLHLELYTDRLEDASIVLHGLLLGHRESDPLVRRR